MYQMHPTILLVLGALPIMTTRHYLQQPASNSNPGLELFFVKAKKWGVCTNEGMNKTMGQAKDFAAMAKGRSWDKWHQILGHVNLWTIKTLLKNNLVTGLLIGKARNQHNAWHAFEGSVMWSHSQKRQLNQQIRSEI